ncbi:ADP-ribosylglycohydrolase family protein [[Clostridium] dakarense]|uniref:ADP-ribosylglycohydrolase family protein n=1 Tax=Faecalimicrobium dakarense TaxID=1301100 RepID=UPI0004B47888|nr:ADP-ribosylglycohydrolase family protein [[Clostridium] dakarense]
MKNKIAGTIYGMALGDAMGMPPELWSRNKVKSYFGEIKEFLDGPKENDVACNYTKGQYTDDTAQALIIIDSLIDTDFIPNPNDIASKLLDWADKENAFENNILGPSSKLALSSFREGKYASEATNTAQSNGSSMRIAPIGCLFKSNEKINLANYVYEVSKITHSSDIAIAGASMIAMAVSSAMENDNFDKIMKDVYEIEKIALKLGADTINPSMAARTKVGVELAKKFDGNDDMFLESIYNIIGAGVITSESVPAALSIAYYAKDANKCSLLCANLGGDTDTIGAMATAICGAFTGIEKINKKYLEVLDKENEVDLNKYIEILDKKRGEKN